MVSGRSNVIEKLEALELENAERMEVEETVRGEARQGRSEMRRFNRQVQDLLTARDFPPHGTEAGPSAVSIVFICILTLFCTLFLLSSLFTNHIVCVPQVSASSILQLR